MFNFSWSSTSSSSDRSSKKTTSTHAPPSSYHQTRRASTILTSNNKLPIGGSLAQFQNSEPERPHTNGWSELDASSFKLRVGPDYVRGSNQKAPSAPALYSLFAMDLYVSPQTKIQNITRFFDLTMLDDQSKSAASPDHPRLTYIPEFYVFHQSLCAHGGPEANGKSVEHIAWCRVTDDVHRIVRQFENGEIDETLLPPSVRLWKKFLDSANDDDAWMERMKLVPSRMQNIDEMASNWIVASMLRQLERPILNSSSLSNVMWDKQTSIATFQLDQHVNGRMAKHVMSSSMSGWKYGILESGYVIEGRTNDELPEQALWTCCMYKFDVDNAPIFPVEIFGDAAFVLEPTCVCG